MTSWRAHRNEPHTRAMSGKLNWLRAGVLGANDGIVSIAGLAVGVVGAWVSSRLMQGLLFGVAPHDPATLAAVAGLIGGVGVAACWVPAERAARVDPAEALRAE